MATDIFSLFELASFDSASIDTDFQKVNTTPYIYPIQLLIITNDSTEPVIISLNGLTDQIYVAAGNKREIYAQVNSQPLGRKSAFPGQLTVWVRGTTAGTGTIAVEAYYNQP
jgi:hypothetical protein